MSRAALRAVRWGLSPPQTLAVFVIDDPRTDLSEQIGAHIAREPARLRYCDQQSIRGVVDRFEILFGDGSPREIGKGAVGRGTVGRVDIAKQ